MNGFFFDRLRMTKALYQQLIDTAVEQFGQMASDNRQKTDSPATIYTMIRADDAESIAYERKGVKTPSLRRGIRH
jgi:hypothetical protein